MSKSLLYSIVLIVPLSLSFWLFIQHRLDASASQQTNEHRPDATAEGIQLFVYNKAGRLTRRIESKRLKHFPKGDTTNFLSPHIYLYSATDNPWYIRSGEGQAMNGFDTVILTGKVLITQTNNAHKTTTINTQSLTYQPNHSQVSTKDWITLQQPGILIRSKGMRAELKQHRIFLTARVRGHYQK